MPKIARKILGLSDGSFSRIGIRGGSIVFESRSDDAEILLPVSMVGIFHNDLLNNLFMYLASNRQNGILAVSTGPLSKVVLFK
ncbi:MAG: hypothetical protein V3T86_07190, partial [Planctomycetota bacterium]